MIRKGPQTSKMLKVDDKLKKTESDQALTLPSPASLSVLKFTSPSHPILKIESVMSVKSLLTPTSPTVNHTHLQPRNCLVCVTVAIEREDSHSLCYLQVARLHGDLHTCYSLEKA